MGDVHTRGTSRIRSDALKFHASGSLSPHLANFRLRALSHSSIALEIVAPPPPPVVPDLGLRACRRLVPSPGARRHLEPQPRSTLLLSSSSSCKCAALGHCRATAVDPASLKGRRCHPLPQALGTAFSKGDTPPLPHYCCRMNVCRNASEI
jgi:hypothetical protein